MNSEFASKESMATDDLLQPSVTIDELIGRVTIDNFICDSPELLNIIRQCDTNVESVSMTKKVIDIGAFVHGKVQLALDTDYVDKRVAEMTHEFEMGLENVKSSLLTTVENNFDPGKSNSYTERIERFFAEKKAEFEKYIGDSLAELSKGKRAISDQIDKSFDPNLRSSHIARFMEFIGNLQKTIKNDFDIDKTGSITNQMRELIRDTLGEDGELAKSIDHRLSFDNPDSTMTILQDNLMRKLEEIKIELAATKSAADTEKAALEKSIQKGYQFENKLFEKLEQFASNRGDFVEDVSNGTGEVTNAKKGDFLYTVAALNKTIAIEAKSTKMPTPKNLLVVLNEAKENRRADLVICIYEDESHLHKQVGAFQEYLPDKIVTHYAFWEVALKIAISRLLIENETIEGLDRVAAENEIEAIKNSLQSFRSIRTAANNIVKEANKIRDRADEIKIDISNSLDTLSDLLITFTDGGNQ